MMSKRYSLLTFSTLLAGMFAASCLAADKVVVIPLKSKTEVVGDATVGDVLVDKTFSSDVGVGLTGTMVNNGAVLVTPSTSAQPIPSGYHNGSGSIAGDPLLVEGNIKDGTTIFGVTGTHTGIGGTVQDTSSGDAGVGDILALKKAWVDGVEITGNVPAGVSINGTNGSRVVTITDGLYSGNKTATANDSNLTSTNIKKDITIFGVTGTMPLAPVPRTGQTPTVPFTAPAGSDGAHQKGTAWPNPRFSDNSDGTVTDNLTGLIWLKNANCTDIVGGVNKSGGSLTWYNALIWSNGLANGDCGLIDSSSAGHWRLPNIQELQSLIAYQYYSPALSNDAGTGQWANDASSAFSGVVSSYYWSSSAYVNNPSGALDINLSYGLTNGNSKSNSYYVWPVRD